MTEIGQPTAAGYFEGRLLIEPVDDFFIIREPYKYVTKSGLPVQVEEGFLFDGMSNPRILWSVCSPFDKRVLMAAGVHDQVYANHFLSQAEADEVLIEGIIGCSDAVKAIIYQAVQTFGDHAYETGPARQAALKKRLAAMGLS